MINDRFVIKKKIGEGRSKVFLYSDVQNDNKEFAIKILSEKAGADEIKTFKEEFHTLRRFNHPSIITAHEEGTVVKITDDTEEVVVGSKFITLDFFNGVELLKYPGLNNEDVLKKIVKQICSVLYYLHQSNYIYYDLKHENILAGTINGEPVIKLIDLGFAQYTTTTDEYHIRGTAEYIAPEILKREPYNHLVDLYSLGILLYRIVYGKFPFDASSEIEIYKAHIEKEFEFPGNHFSEQLIEVIKKLLSKNPVDRYINSLQVLSHLGIEISADIYKDFLPAKIFTDRKEVISITGSLLSDLNNKEIIIFSGYEGAGKTSVAHELHRKIENVIIISESAEKRGIDFVLYTLGKIFFSDFVYSNLSLETLKNTEEILAGTRDTNVDSLKALFNKISSEAKFILIIDDFNFLDEFAIELWKELLPILQINNIRVILTEVSEKSRLTEFIYARHEINLIPFTKDELSEYIDDTFASFFPKDQLKKLILDYSDLLPGSIISFIKDLILLRIIRFSQDGPVIESGEESVALLKSSHEEIFKLRLNLLNEDELRIAKTISSFEINPDINILADSVGLDTDKIKDNISDMIQKNILQQANIFSNPSFTSESLKHYVYTGISDKESVHQNNALVIAHNFNEFSRTELARQYELAKDYFECYKVYIKEHEDAEKISAFSYQKKILMHLLEIPLADEIKDDIRYRLCKTLYRLNDARSALELITSIINNITVKETENELLIIKGSCLIELGEIENGKQILLELSQRINDELKKQKLFVEIAYADFDLGLYDSAKKICNELINNPSTIPENKGKCFNLLGLLNTYQDNNLDEALNNFQGGLEMYRKAKLKLNEAKIEVNIGNTYNRIGNYENAEKHWKNSLNANTSIGNLDYEAKILINFGIFYYNKANFTKAIENYTRAFDIFSSFGNRNGQGLVLTNLGEIYLTKSEYQNSFESFNKARDIFKIIQNKEEEAEVSFMLCKLFFIIGDDEQFKKVLYDFKSLLDENNLTERQTSNYKVLELLNSFDENETRIPISAFEEILNVFIEKNEGLFFTESYSVLCEYLIQHGLYEEAFIMLNNSHFIKTCTENYLSMARRFYLQGLIVSRSNKFGLPPPLESLNEAYELIKDEIVTELTWKVLYELSENYLLRGNINKANDFLYYSKEVIKFIADSIKNFDLKLKYLSKTERKVVIEK